MMITHHTRHTILTITTHTMTTHLMTTPHTTTAITAITTTATTTTAITTIATMTTPHTQVTTTPHTQVTTTPTPATPATTMLNIFTLLMKHALFLMVKVIMLHCSQMMEVNLTYILIQTVPIAGLILYTKMIIALP